jgi:hypothetical protein
MYTESLMDDAESEREGGKDEQEHQKKNDSKKGRWKK